MTVSKIITCTLLALSIGGSVVTAARADDAMTNQDAMSKPDAMKKDGMMKKDAGEQ